MAQNNTNIAGTSHRVKEFDKNYYEEIAKKTDSMLQEMKIYLDKVLGLRGIIIYLMDDTFAYKL